MKRFVHSIMMLWPTYAKNFRMDTAIGELQSEISKCHHGQADMSRIRDIVAKLCRIDKQGLSKAAKLLADGNNFECKQYAVVLNPSLGKYCGDQLMETARKHIELYGHMDRATWARKRLLLARQWYEAAGALTKQLRSEIEDGLQKTAWIGNH